MNLKKLNQALGESIKILEGKSDKYLAIKRGSGTNRYYLTTAKKYRGRWMIGGDVDTTNVTILKKDQTDDRWKAYTLKGNRMVFSDYVDEDDLRKYEKGLDDKDLEDVGLKDLYK